MFKSANPIVVSGRSTSTPRECSSIFASVRRSGFRGNPIWFHLFWCFQYLFFLFPFLFIFFFCDVLLYHNWHPNESKWFPFPLYSRYHLPSRSFFFLISWTRLRLWHTNRIPSCTPIHSRFFVPALSNVHNWYISLLLPLCIIPLCIPLWLFPNITRIRFTKYEDVILLSSSFFDFFLFFWTQLNSYYF